MLRRFAEADEARAEDLASVLDEQDVVAAAIWVNEPEDGGPAGICVHVDPVHAERAETIATAFDAEHDSALDYLAARGVDQFRPVRAGCGLFWFFPVVLTAMGALGLAGIGTNSPTVAGALLALGLLMVAAFRWFAAQRASDADDVERRA